MEHAWKNFLEEQFDLSTITHAFIYTDQKQFWLLNGLISILKSYRINIATQFLDEVTSDDALDIQNSFASLPATSIIFAIFSEDNRYIDLLNRIFPPLRVFQEYTGYSVVSMQNFIPQNYSDFLEIDYQKALVDMDQHQALFTSGKKYNLTTELGTDLSFSTNSNLFNFPFHSSMGRNILFPAMELISEIEPRSLNGTLYLDGTIGLYKSRNSIIDPFGKIYSPIEIHIQNGTIVSIDGADRFVNRLKEFIPTWKNDFKGTQKIGIGIGPEIPLTGNIEVDKMIANTCNFSLGERELDLLFLRPRFSLL